MKGKGGRGHSFQWWYGPDYSHFEPYPDTLCTYCKTQYDQITDIHYCPEKYRLDHEPQLVLPECEGTP